MKRARKTSIADRQYFLNYTCRSTSRINYLIKVQTSAYSRTYIYTIRRKSVTDDKIKDNVFVFTRKKQLMYRKQYRLSCAGLETFTYGMNL